eukprot:CAMPEP_0116848016 /NCGR_PEP_ID=MMETSP0418-20121206/14756_1 /TAXON_ID=1158023 /ORGANISM="Astrosyne radiata, Strain 13vi08-1A" /LENGTH=99 /DNA_ID=CAMNT_0004479527 /DNA_START=65 /DNA_END=364 /DNA_ORIENTATION=-
MASVTSLEEQLAQLKLQLESSCLERDELVVHKLGLTRQNKKLREKLRDDEVDERKEQPEQRQRQKRQSFKTLEYYDQRFMRRTFLTRQSSARNLNVVVH